MVGNNDAMAANDAEATDACNHQRPGQVGKFHPMDDNNHDDDAALRTTASAADPITKSKRRKKRVKFGRSVRGGDRKRSTSPHTPNLPRNPAQQTQTPPLVREKNDPRVADLKRTNKRQQNRMNNQKEKLADATTENKQLEKRLKTAEMEMEATVKSAEQKMSEAQRQTEVEMEKAVIMKQRASKQMKRAAEVSRSAAGKKAEATKVEAEAKQARKNATKEKTAATNEKKKVNAKVLSVSNKSKKQISARDEEIENLKAQLRDAQKTACDLEKEALKQKALREEAEQALEDMGIKIEDLNALLEKEAETGRIVIKKDSVEGKAFKMWSKKIVQLIMEYLVCNCKCSLCCCPIFHFCSHTLLSCQHM